MADPSWLPAAKKKYDTYYRNALLKLNVQLKAAKDIGSSRAIQGQISQLQAEYNKIWNSTANLKAWYEKLGGDTTDTYAAVRGAADAKAAEAQAKADAEAAAAKEAAAQDAYALMKMQLDQWGLGGLADTALNLARQGYGTNQILLMLRDTDAYKTRFKGNADRIKNGYAALAPDEYLSVEDAYQRVLQSYGLPKGFYDSNDDFAGWIGMNVSAAEIENRAQMAANAANNSDQWQIQALRDRGLGDGDMTAFFLDQGRAMPILNKVVGTSKLGAAMLKNGLADNQDRAAYWYDQMGGNVSQADADRAYSQVAAALPLSERLGTIYGQGLNQTDLEDEALGNSEVAAAKRRSVGLNETNSFSGSGAATTKGLGQGSRGTF